MNCGKIFSFALILILAGCAKESLTHEEYNEYLLDPEHGLTQEEVLNGTKVAVTFRPTDLIVEQTIGGENIDIRSIDSLRSIYGRYYYFVVRFSRDDKEALHSVPDYGKYSDLLQTLSFRMHDYVTLTTAEADTIPVGDFMLDRTFGMSTSTDLLFVFSKDQTKGAEWVQFNLNEFGLSLGNQRFRFRTKDLDSAPKMKFSVIYK